MSDVAEQPQAGKMEEEEEVFDDSEENSSDETDDSDDMMSAAEMASQHKQKGNEYYNSHSYTNAIKSYTEAIKLQPAEQAFYSNRAAAYFNLGDFQSSLADCKHALQLNKDYIKAFNRAGSNLLHMGRFDESETMFKEALKRNAKDKAAKKGLSHIKIASGFIATAQKQVETKYYSGALNSIKEASKLASACPRCKEIKLEALVGQKHYSIAISFSTQLVRDKMVNNRVLLLRATCFYQQDKFDSALKHLQEVLRRDPDDKSSQLLYKKVKKLSKAKERGNQAFKSGQWQVAIDEYTAALQIDPELKKFNAKLYCNKAACLMRLKKYTEATQNCNAAIVNNVSYVKAYQRRGNCLLELGGKSNIQQALQDYTRAKELLGEGVNTRELDKLIQKGQVLLKRANRKDFYKILGVSHSVTNSDIKKAYFKKAKIWHPDKFARASPAEQKKAEMMFKDINQAKSVLSDANKRRRYDAGEDDVDNPGSGHSHGGIDPSQIFEMFMGGRGGSRRGGGGFHGFR